MLANVFRFFVLKIKGRSMVRALCISLALLIGCHGEGQSLQINIKANDEEKLIYLHMWGPIVPGDDEMFKSTILPYLRNGYLLFQVMTFTSGGDVRAAMRIGDQIRTLQARTVAPTQFVNEPGYAQCWFVASAANGGVGYSPSTNYKRQLATGTGASWCNCASACFLIWASGATREGNYVGIHRFKFDELFYGGLAAGQARELYTKAENDYRSYLTRLNISEAILDRLFATDSRSMYYLTHNELQMIQSTPYLEELTQAKCPPDRTKREYNPDGTWRGTTFDSVRIACYREILKELMREGARNYLAALGETATEAIGVPSIIRPTAPAVKGETHWNHNGSSVKLEVEKARRRFLFVAPRDGLKEVGVTAGMTAFDGRRVGKNYEGIAYVFSQRCGPVGYRVKGPIAQDQHSVTVKGLAPYVDSECRVSGGHESVLVFELIE